MSTPSRWEAFVRALPAAPGINAQKIRGNISDTDKQLSANIFTYFTTGSDRFLAPAPFAREIGRRLRIVELNVRENEPTGTAESELVAEIEVAEDMSNVYGTMHGACAVCLLDPTTVGAMVLLGLVKGFDGTGVSQVMNIHWHHPARLGCTLVITTRSVFYDGRVKMSRCEVNFGFYPPLIFAEMIGLDA
ncbi:hypothetical protein B0H15DRAFT_771944 [Mycena belliarum]|uniref:Thioesterase domain-containing protein n=1 Tax=Mycena belliarum TaxID=1033014 RepID=A0AAD6XVB1_9AGAR|nr:hypothetical protein B0H15DRAFT_771944 [Mycena belliae]